MTQTITLITGNPGKLKEIQQITPSTIQLISKKIDLQEIQSLNLHEIAEEKVKHAYAITGGPVMIEDVSAGLDDLKGLPGPFYKFFRDELGDEILLKLSEISSTKVTVICTAAYYDGKHLLITQGQLHGNVTVRRGENGFGFDPFIIPDGESRTLAEMSPGEKNRISHRGKAIRALFDRLTELPLQ